MPGVLAFLLILALAACAGPGGSFPSLQPRPGETPRVIPAPDAGTAPTLSAEEQAALAADLAREQAAFAATEAALAAAERALAPALVAARGAPRGSESWSNAQMALSRYDLARAPLRDIEARLTPLLRTIDSLAADHPDRQAVESLAAATARAAADSDARVTAAGRQLGA